MTDVRGRSSPTVGQVFSVATDKFVDTTRNHNKASKYFAKTTEIIDVHIEFYATQIDVGDYDWKSMNENIKLCNTFLVKYAHVSLHSVSKDTSLMTHSLFSVDMYSRPVSSLNGCVAYSENVMMITATSAGRNTITYIHDEMNAGSGPQKRCNFPNVSSKYAYSPPERGTTKK